MFKIKNIIVSVLVFSLLAFSFPSFSVKAVSISDLQAQIAVLMQQVASLQTKLQEISSSVANTTTTGACFTKNLYRGMTDSEVSLLQTSLKRDYSVYPEGLVTGYFGPLTEKAVQRLQAKYGVSFPETEGYGNVTSATINKLNELYCNSGSINPVITPTPTPYKESIGGEAKISFKGYLNAPLNLTATLISDNQASLNWKEASRSSNINPSDFQYEDGSHPSAEVVARLGLSKPVSMYRIMQGNGPCGPNTVFGEPFGLDYSTNAKVTAPSSAKAVYCYKIRAVYLDPPIGHKNLSPGDPNYYSNFLSSFSNKVTDSNMVEVVFNSGSTNPVITPVVPSPVVTPIPNVGSLNITGANNSNSSIVLGSTNIEIGRFNAVAGNENIKVSDLVATIICTNFTTEIKNVKLYLGNTQIGMTNSVIPCNSRDDVLWGWGFNDFDVNAGQTEVISIRGDLTGWTNGVGNIKVNLKAGNNNYQGISSGIYSSTSAVSGNSLAVVSNSISVTKNTDLEDDIHISIDPNSSGEANVKIGSFEIKTSGGGVNITHILLKDVAGSFPTYYSGLRLISENNQVGDNVIYLNNTSNSLYSFLPSYVVGIESNSTKVFDVYADIKNPSSSSWIIAPTVVVDMVYSVGSLTNQEINYTTDVNLQKVQVNTITP